MSNISSLEELYAGQLRELFSTETQSIPALRTLADTASDPILAEVFREHFAETIDHAARLVRLLGEIGHDAPGGDCEAIGGLVRDVQRAAYSDTPALVRDVALISAAQRIEHYEMACYGSVRTYATVLGHDEAAVELQEILDQESDSDLRLTEVAERLNVEARAEAPAIAAFHERKI